jgi:hypothetical protein
MFRFEYDEKGACTGICSDIGLLERLRATTYSSPLFLFVARLSARHCRACIDRVGLKGSPSTLRRAPQSQRKSRRVESAGLKSASTA